MCSGHGVDRHYHQPTQCFSGVWGRDRSSHTDHQHLGWRNVLFLLVDFDRGIHQLKNLLFGQQWTMVCQTNPILDCRVMFSFICLVYIYICVCILLIYYNHYPQTLNPPELTRLILTGTLSPGCAKSTRKSTRISQMSSDFDDPNRLARCVKMCERWFMVPCSWYLLGKCHVAGKLTDRPPISSGLGMFKPPISAKIGEGYGEGVNVGLGFPPCSEKMFFFVIWCYFQSFLTYIVVLYRFIKLK